MKEDDLDHLRCHTVDRVANEFDESPKTTDDLHLGQGRFFAVYILQHIGDITHDAQHMLLQNRRWIWVGFPFLGQDTGHLPQCMSSLHSSEIEIMRYGPKTKRYQPR